MIVEKLPGTDARLYALVAPLVMSVPIIRQNNNYPFKTSRKHLWFIALERGEVKGFMPVERKTAGACIDNYYLAGDSSELLTSLIEKAKKSLPKTALFMRFLMFGMLMPFGRVDFLN